MYKVLSKDTIQNEIIPHLSTAKRGFKTKSCLIEFDSALIDAETYHARLHEDKIKYKGHICTMRAGTNFCKLPGIYDTYKYPKLEELAEACGIPIPEGAFDSVSGCRITAQCAKRLSNNGYLGNE